MKDLFIGAALSAALLFSLASCRAGEANEPQSVKKAEVITAVETEIKSEEILTRYTEKTEQKSRPAVSRTAKTEESVITIADKEEKKPTPEREDKTSVSTAPAAEEKSEVQTASVISKAQTVRVTVNCRHAVEYRDAHPEKEIYIPQNSGGTICTGEIVPVQGDTALSVLKKELEASGVSITENRGYVSGIGELYEKACGGTSGWMFTINGETPFVSADKTPVDPGDEVVFYYVVNYGDPN